MFWTSRMQQWQAYTSARTGRASKPAGRVQRGRCVRSERRVEVEAAREQVLERGENRGLVALGEGAAEQLFELGRAEGTACEK